MPVDYMSLLAQQDDDPLTEDRLNALRRQSAVGQIATMGGANLAPMGAGLMQGAEQEIARAEKRQGQGLDRAMKQAQLMELQRKANKPPDPKARYNIVSDGMGGFMSQDKFTGEVTPYSGVTLGGKSPEMVEGQFDPGYVPNFGKMTEVQSKSQLYGMNAAPALGTLRTQIGTGFTPSLSAKMFYETGGLGAKGTLSGYAASDEDVAFVRDSKDLIAAILRKESGAAITETEWASGAQRFIPMPWDTPEQMQAKLNAAEVALQNIALTAGPAAGYVRNYIDYHANPKSREQAVDSASQQAGGGGANPGTAIKLTDD